VLKPSEQVQVEEGACVRRSTRGPWGLWGGDGAPFGAYWSLPAPKSRVTEGRPCRRQM